MKYYRVEKWVGEKCFDYCGGYTEEDVKAMTKGWKKQLPNTDDDFLNKLIDAYNTDHVSGMYMRKNSNTSFFVIED